MQTRRIERYRECEAALRNTDLRQAMYDAGEIITRGTLLMLHAKPHLKRREIESRVFRRNFFKYYETQVFPATLEHTIAPFIEGGGGDLIDLGYRLTVNLTADFAGVDRPLKTIEETEKLIRLTKKFSEAATMVHSTRDKAELEAEVHEAIAEFDKTFLSPSIARREALLARLAAGEIEEDELPRDILTVILRAQDELQFDHAQRIREVGFYMQAGSHSTANSVVHALEEILTWAGEDAARWERLEDPIFVQHCVHESIRLHPASPEAWRAPTCPMYIEGAGELDTEEILSLDFYKANRDPEVFGADAECFDPDRPAPKGAMKTGLSFGFGTHHCLGRELDGGVLAKPGTPREKLQLGIVPSVVVRLLASGARKLADDPPTPDPKTTRPNWGRYPIEFTKEAS
jgi:cytochrome P450